MTEIIDLSYDFDKGTINQKLARLPEQIEAAGMVALDEGATFIVNMAKNLVLVDTGTLQKSIRKQRTRDKVVSVRAGGYFVNPKTGVICNYAHWVEIFHPYMRPAVEMARNYIIDLIKSGVVASVE